MLAVLQQLNFCYSLRFIIISCVDGTFHVSLMGMRNALELAKFAGIVFRKFCNWNREKFRKFLYWAKTNFLTK